MNKVTISENTILVNGEAVGYFGGSRSEVWVYLKSAKTGRYEFGGRFKYMFAKTQSKRYVKYVLQRVSVQEMIDGIAEKTPHDFAKSMGFDWYVEVRKKHPNAVIESV